MPKLGPEKAQKVYAIARYIAQHPRFIPERDPEYAPPKGTIFHDLWRGGRMTRRHCRAALLLYHDAINAIDTPVKVTQYGERVSTSGVSQILPMRARNECYERIRNLAHRLHAHEKRNIEIIIQEYHNHRQPDYRLCLVEFGKLKTNYRNKDQARAAGAAYFLSFLDSVADFYRIS